MHYRNQLRDSARAGLGRGGSGGAGGGHIIRPPADLRWWSAVGTFRLEQY
jgi:hypothetical protein